MKTTITHCVAGAKLSSESALVEKPAVGIVVRACAIAWKGDISLVDAASAQSPSRIAKSAAVSAM